MFAFIRKDGQRMVGVIAVLLFAANYVNGGFPKNKKKKTLVQSIECFLPDAKKQFRVVA